MFEKAWQGSPAFEILSPQGANPTANWKVNGVQRLFDKNLKGFIFHLTGNASMRLCNSPAGLVQPILVLQVFLPQGKPFSVELGITDVTKTRRRLLFSSAFKEMSTNPLHARFPLVDSSSVMRVQRDCWINLCFNMETMVPKAWPGQHYKTLDSLQISPDCRLRKVYTIKNQPIHVHLLRMQDGTRAMAQIIDGSGPALDKLDERPELYRPSASPDVSFQNDRVSPSLGATAECIGYDDMVQAAHVETVKIKSECKAIVNRRSPKGISPLDSQNLSVKADADTRVDRTARDQRAETGGQRNWRTKGRRERQNSMRSGRKFGSTSGLSNFGSPSDKRRSAGEENTSPSRDIRRRTRYPAISSGAIASGGHASVRLSQTQQLLPQTMRSMRYTSADTQQMSGLDAWDSWKDTQITADSPSQLLQNKEKELVERLKRLSLLEKADLPADDVVRYDEDGQPSARLDKNEHLPLVDSGSPSRTRASSKSPHTPHGNLPIPPIIGAKMPPIDSLPLFEKRVEETQPTIIRYSHGPLSPIEKLERHEEKRPLRAPLSPLENHLISSLEEEKKLGGEFSTAKNGDSMKFVVPQNGIIFTVLEDDVVLKRESVIAALTPEKNCPENLAEIVEHRVYDPSIYIEERFDGFPDENIRPPSDHAAAKSPIITPAESADPFTALNSSYDSADPPGGVGVEKSVVEADPLASPRRRNDMELFMDWDKASPRESPSHPEFAGKNSKPWAVITTEDAAIPAPTTHSVGVDYGEHFTCPFTPPVIESPLLKLQESRDPSPSDYIEVMFDPLLDIYYDPLTNKYYELRESLDKR